MIETLIIVFPFYLPLMSKPLSTSMLDTLCARLSGSSTDHVIKIVMSISKSTPINRNKCLSCTAYKVRILY